MKTIQLFILLLQPLFMVGAPHPSYHPQVQDYTMQVNSKIGNFYDKNNGHLGSPVYSEQDHYTTNKNILHNQNITVTHHWCTDPGMEYDYWTSSDIDMWVFLGNSHYELHNNVTMTVLNKEFTDIVSPYITLKEK